jgi:hypothetical protein
MACCIFAAFLFTQILAFLEATGLRSGERAQARRAAEQNWRLGDVAAPMRGEANNAWAADVDRSVQGRHTIRLIGFEVVLLIGAAIWLFALGGADAIAKEIQYLSQVRSFSDFLALCGL